MGYFRTAGSASPALAGLRGAAEVPPASRRPGAEHAPAGTLSHGPPSPGQRAPFVPVLARLEPEQVDRLDLLAARTRIPKAVFLREAVTDLLEKYRRELAGDQVVDES